LFLNFKTKLSNIPVTSFIGGVTAGSFHPSIFCTVRLATSFCFVYWSCSDWKLLFAAGFTSRPRVVAWYCARIYAATSTFDFCCCLKTEVNSIQIWSYRLLKLLFIFKCSGLFICILVQNLQSVLISALFDK
jgi:hypothetical protein